MSVIGTTRILLDVSHNERLTTFSDTVFDPQYALFSFNDPSDSLTDLTILKKYNLILIGNPIPRKNPEEKLFTGEDVNTLKRYVIEGGAILLTVGSRGDYDFPINTGSIRALVGLTGVQQFPYGLLLNPQKAYFTEKKYNLTLSPAKGNTILSPEWENPVIFGKATYLIRDPEIPTKAVLFSPPATQYHDYARDQNIPLQRSPLLLLRELGEGRVATVSCTQFLTEDPITGVSAGSNRDFIIKLFSWLMQKKLR